MIGVTFFGVFLTPVFHTVIRRLTGKNTLKHTPSPHSRPPSEPQDGNGDAHAATHAVQAQ